MVVEVVIPSEGKEIHGPGSCSVRNVRESIFPRARRWRLIDSVEVERKGSSAGRQSRMEKSRRWFGFALRVVLGQ